MTAQQANEKTKKYNAPLQAALAGLLDEVYSSVKIGEFSYWHNTAQPDIEVLKEFIKTYEYRVFIRKGNDCNGYPLWCIYWGDEQNPIPNFNTSDKEKIYELKVD